MQEDEPMSIKRRRMREFEIDEISAVDRPAQAHARMSVMKRDDSPVGFDTFGEAVAAIAKAGGVSRIEAMSRIARTHPDLVKKHQAEYDDRIEKAAASSAQPRLMVKAIQTWNDRVGEVARRDGVGRTEAMSRARAEFPAVFKSYEEA